jgi:dihydropteroate synthase
MMCREQSAAELSVNELNGSGERACAKPDGQRKWAGFSLIRPLIMGIVNVTPDSFSDKVQHATPDAAIAGGLVMLREGADIIDVGGESTRPGADEVDPAEEAERILPVIRPLVAAGAVVSVDTRHAEVMAAALDQGARIVNDVSALRHDPGAAAVIVRYACPVILMHMRGTPRTMGRHAQYADLLRDVISELAGLRDAAIAAGVAPETIALDPGFGFAKTGEQTILLLRAMARFQDLGHPLVAGVSRKRFIGTLADESDPAQRDPGSIMAAVFAASHGAAILRVHNVSGTKQALRVWHALTAS